MTVGFHSPLPPAATGVADYSAALLPELRRHGRVSLPPERCDVALYHVGNNQLHASIYSKAVSKPGVVVLHDAVLQHFYLGSFSQTSYLNEFAANYGPWSAEEGKSLWRDRALSSQDPRYFERPMLKRIAERSLAVVVHNPAAALAVKKHSPATRVTEIPHFYQAVPALSRTAGAEFRGKHGIPENGFVFAIFGFLRESKRLLPCLTQFQKLRRLNPNTHLLIAGEFVSQDLERSVLPVLKQPGVHRIGHIPAERFQLALNSINCCLNLRYPSAGETSGIALRAMGAGKPVIVTKGEEWARFPGTTLFQIPSGLAEGVALFEVMALLSDNPELGKHMGRQASEYIQRYHSLSASGAEYWNLLCRTLDSPSC